MLPKAIYKLLPYTYILSGLIVFLQLDSSIGQVSGAILVLAGVLVMYWRHSYGSFKKAP